MTELVLETSALTKRFGGLTAVDGVGLKVARGSVHCVIGPNGAGKTTLINLLSGDLKPTSGHVRLEGEDITGLPPYQVSKRGIGRSYQRTNIFPEFTVFENAWLAAQSRLPSSMRFFRPAAKLGDVAKRTERALVMAGLGERAQTPAAVLSHGEQRQLEIALILATEPKVLLLDEPMAGMSADESLRMVDLLRRLKGDHTLILIEHDMDAVFAVADVITVMVNGAVLESGPPAQIRASRTVQEAYLGEGAAA
ncbi:MAG TPA: ABC transporter ATP-binding protein [Alphaproteobacteria bacterium]|nr:ABC transporter ATP-binding protein [Alphaproteobacteria bacterium]